MTHAAPQIPTTGTSAQWCLSVCTESKPGIVSEWSHQYKKKQQVEKLQMEIEAKSHTISALLLPSNEHQDIIRRLEDELQEVREAHRIATLKEKSNKLATISESAEYDNHDNNNTDGGINGSSSDNESNNHTNNNRNGSLSPEMAYSSDKLEQNIDENVKELEEKIKDLEVQLTNA